MSFRLPLFAAFVLTPLPLAAQDAPDAGPGIVVTAERKTPAEELVLPPDHIITVVIDGTPLRLLVTADASGPAAIDPRIVVRLGWGATFQTHWDYGNGDVLKSAGTLRIADFGDRKATLPVMWSFGLPTMLADGMIGIHNLPYKRIVMPLAAPVGEQTVQRFPLQRFAGQRAMRVGTEIDADGRRLKAIFATDYTDNVVTAPTANWLATRFDGGFLPGSEGKLRMRFGVERRTRMMRLARPLELGDLLIDRFAVRLADYGKARNVGEAGENDPRFDPNEIVVSERKPRGRVDMLTRIGRNQIAHCSTLTYDLENNEIRLACGTPPAS
ncbi:hypothetical protein [Porphyrobacter sp. CACIAM 03H1]|uniref:hypothetical protein n=1 Tax=Porphyrobacter sp. CACIAM 03H1 TaxID=2003315 RepID=UPI000B5A9BB3|nr:hypothetical protein [Porphyrobacter sp. CACIAM 03H1]ASJ90221.1 hypothetical protein CBR61_04300 [Porphyrobacter sp. CACIAM 03H1]